MYAVANFSITSCFTAHFTSNSIILAVSYGASLQQCSSATHPMTGLARAISKRSYRNRYKFRTVTSYFDQYGFHDFGTLYCKFCKLLQLRILDRHQSQSAIYSSQRAVPSIPISPEAQLVGFLLCHYCCSP